MNTILRDAFDSYLDGKGSLTHWMDLLNFQDFAYPKNYNKLRYLENHDTDRIAPRVKDDISLRNYTALIFFLKGTTLLYGGQEFAAEHRPDLFDADKIEWDTGKDLSPYISKLAGLRKQTLSPEDIFFANADEESGIAVLIRDDRKNCKIAVFSSKGFDGDVKVDLPDGAYDELISGGKIDVKDGIVHCSGEPLWISVPSDISVTEV